MLTMRLSLQEIFSLQIGCYDDEYNSSEQWDKGGII